MQKANIDHTDPVFKMYSILKLEDIFIIQGYQLYGKIMTGYYYVHHILLEVEIIM